METYAERLREDDAARSLVVNVQDQRAVGFHDVSGASSSEQMACESIQIDNCHGCHVLIFLP
jgi:hypothetical protein